MLIFKFNFYFSFSFPMFNFELNFYFYFDFRCLLSNSISMLISSWDVYFLNEFLFSFRFQMFKFEFNFYFFISISDVYVRIFAPIVFGSQRTSSGHEPSQDFDSKRKLFGKCFPILERLRCLGNWRGNIFKKCSTWKPKPKHSSFKTLLIWTNSSFKISQCWWPLYMFTF